MTRSLHDNFVLGYSVDGVLPESVRIRRKSEDPPPAFLARFDRSSTPVEPVSAAEVGPVTGVSHRQKGGRGLIFKQTGIVWIDGDTVEVEGGYYEAGLSSAGELYRVERHNGTWTVTSSRMRWIS